MKGIKSILLAIAVIGVVVAWFVMGKNAVVFEDTNGPEDTSLAIITEEDILAKGAGTVVAGPRTKERKGSIFGVNITSGVEYFSEDFSGVYVLKEWDFLSKAYIQFDLYDFQVTGGNFRMCVISENGIVQDIQPGELVEVRLQDMDRGKYAVVIAGESAAFTFTSYELTPEA